MRKFLTAVYDKYYNFSQESGYQKICIYNRFIKTILKGKEKKPTMFILQEFLSDTEAQTHAKL